MPGFYVELGQRIAERLRRPFEVVWVRGYFGKRTVRTSLLAEKCDGFVGLPDTPDFMGPRLIFSRPILQVGYALVTPNASVNGLAGLAGKRVAVQFASPPQSLLADKPTIQAVTALTPEETIGHLSEGRADAALVWGPIAGWINKTALGGTYAVRPIEGDRMQWNAAIGFPRRQEALRDEVNRVLSEVAGEIEILKAKYGFPEAPPIRLAGIGPETAAAAGPTSGAPTESLPAPAPQQGGQEEARATRTAVGAAEAAGEVAMGHKLFNANCSHCHGPDAIQGERRRNLRLLRRRHGDEMDQVFMATVTQGRVSKGMPNWSGILSNEQFERILAFLHTVQEP